MIPHLAPASICVIEDEAEDYEPIQAALLRMGMGSIHVKGDSVENLPEKPLTGLRLIFMDLHLNGTTGKNAASHAARVFIAVVSPDPAPVVVVIWSKHKDDLVNDLEALPENSQTEEDLFRETLREAMRERYEHLVFLVLPKPYGKDRPDDGGWISELEKGIQQKLSECRPFDVLWSWESLVRNVGLSVSNDLMEMVLSNPQESSGRKITIAVKDKLAMVLKHLAQEQGGPDCSPGTASRHLLNALSYLGEDRLEQVSQKAGLQHHGEWLATPLNEEHEKPFFESMDWSAHLNSMLLTASVDPADAPYLPGTVYKFDRERVSEFPLLSLDMLLDDCIVPKLKPDKIEAFKKNAVPVLVELTPACDFQQSYRRSAFLVAGFQMPADLRPNARSKDACRTTPVFVDRYTKGADGKVAGSKIALVFCSRHRFTVDLTKGVPSCLTPWFRLRDMFATDFRAWHGSQISRVGFLSV